MNVFGHINFQTVILYLIFPFFEFIANSPMTFRWTDQQRAAAVKEGWGYLLLFSARLVGVFLVADALFIGAQQVDRVFRI
ncbi:hypothetical protein BDE02_12G071000 [Populus trichocarpa]|nr:hypothetical protein BDE02_12G071000 [Populus trichocarpa]